MNILLLEDNPRRIKIFKAGLKNHKLTICGHAKSAKKALKTQSFDIIFLDHDLRGKPEDPDSDNCGSEVARFIVDRDIACEHIILHTENDRGRAVMEDLLPHSQTIPYGQLKRIGVYALVKGLTDDENDKSDG